MRNYTVFFLLFFVLKLSAQPWIDNGLDVNGNPNFFVMQSLAQDYFSNINIEEKGKGYKAYKRWEEYWKDRVYEDGSFPEAGLAEKNFKAFLKNQQDGDRMMVADWESLGPSTTGGGYAGIGRIACIAFHPTNTNILWVGSPGGGLWKSTNGGDSWTTSFDNEMVLGVSSILILPTNPDIMYIATGDGDAGDTNSTGVLKSTDGGVTWQTTGLNWTVSQSRRIRKLIFDPDNTNTILAATTNGLYRSLDAGATFTQIVNDNFYDLEANPNAATNTFYASTNNDIYVSTNNGTSWTIVQTVSSCNRIALGVSPHNANYVYALCSNSSNSGFLGMYRSTDSGASFTLRSSSPNIMGWNGSGSDTGGQGWYDLCVAVDPTNAEIVYTGGVNIWKSTDGGSTWAVRTHWSGFSGVQTVHADQHTLDWQNNTTLWLGNDGGIYRTTNGGVNWTHKTNTLIISQMYRIAVSQADAKFLTGLQDNGTKMHGTSGSWSDVIGGDGMDCAVRPDVTTVLYGSSQNGNFRRSTNGGGGWSTMTVPDAGTGAWITPIIVDPSNPSHVYIGFNRVHKSTDQGSTWTTISGTLNSSDLTFMAIAPSNASTLYAGRTNALYRTTDGGTNWSTMTVPTGSGYNDIVVSPTNPNTLWIVRTGYNSGSKVYKSVNGGSTWTNISGNLPNLSANCIIYQDGTDDGLYVGMDVGVYYIDNSMSQWELYSTGLPNVEVFDLKIKYNTGELYAATYGRGAWKTPLRAFSACQSPLFIYADTMGVHDATFRWSPPELNPFASYIYALTTSATPPGGGTATSDTFAIFTGLLSNTAYYFHIRSVCGEDGFSAWTTSGPHWTAATCLDTSFDTGGSANNYNDNEDIIRYICPTGPYQQAVLTFTDFEVEANWDALYVHNGNSINDPIFSSGNPATQAGFPPGGYYGTTIPGPFISTHPSGCLTLHFLSDEGVTGRGWVAPITCLDNCSSSVRNTNNDGSGSLRNVMTCADPGSNIICSPLVNNLIIDLTAPIIVDKNLTLSPVGLNITIRANYSGHIFEILPGKTLNLQNLSFIGGTGTTNTRVFINQGILEMTDVDILDTNANNGSGKTIDNLGNIHVQGDFQIRDN